MHAPRTVLHQHPSDRQGRFVSTMPGEMNAWLANESGKPVHVATENIDLTAELKRGLSFVRREREPRDGKEPAGRSKKPKRKLKRPMMHVTKWLGDIPVETGCSECASVVLKAIGSSHRPNREEYQKSFQQRGHCKTYTSGRVPVRRAH